MWNSFIKLGLPVLALALVALQGGATGVRVAAALLGIAGPAAAVGIGTHLWWRRRSLVTLGEEAPTPAGVEAT